MFHGSGTIVTAYGLILVVSTIAAFVLALVVRWSARRLGVVDAPEGFRKVHGRPVPLLGGVAIFPAFFVSLAACRWLTGEEQLATFLRSPDFQSLLGGAAAVLLVGTWDDVRGMRARWKLVALGLVALAMYICGYRITGVSNPLGGSINLGLFAMPLTVFWFLGCMNAMNLIDGLDGLAAGVTIFAAGTIFLVGLLFGNTLAALLCLALAGSTVGFLLLNFHPASIYLGDSGSLLLGFLFACIGLRSVQKGTMVVALLIPIIALGLPIMDTALAILRRWTKAVPLTAGDHQHIHHKLLELGLSHRCAVLLMYAACILLCGLALLMTAANSLQRAGLLAMLGVVTFLVVRLIGRHELRLLRKRLAGYVERRKRRVQCRVAGYEASAKMRHAGSVADLWHIFAEAAETMALDRAQIVLDGKPEPRRQPPPRYRWRAGPDGRDSRPDDVLWSATVSLYANGRHVGRLHVMKTTNGQPLGAEVPETLELLAKALAINIDRVQGEVHSARQ